MLEEWMCLGGVEVANNARTYGYATTSDCPVSWFRKAPCEGTWDALNDWIMPVWQWQEVARNWTPNPSMEAAGGTQTLWTNRFTNPSMESTSGTVEVRRNLATDPRAIATGITNNQVGWQARWFGGTGAGTVFPITASDGPEGITTYIRKTWTTAPGGNGDTGFTNARGDAPAQGTAGEGLPVTVGTTYTVSSWLRTNSAGGKIARIGMFWKTSTGAFVSVNYSATSTDIVGKGWVRLTATATAPATATHLGINTDVMGGGTVWAVGDTLDGTGLLVEASPVSGIYFDGSTPPKVRRNLFINPSFDGPASIVAAAGGTATRPNDGGYVGTYYGRVTREAPDGQVGFDTFSSGGASPAVTAGATYTYSAWLRCSVETSVNVNPVHAGGAGGSIVPFALVANVWTRVSVTWTSTTGGAAGLRVRTGTVPVGATIDVDGFLLEESATLGTYFDGSSGAPQGFDEAWEGTANASPSYLYDTDFTPAWVGTANVSASVLNGAGVPSYTSAIAGKGISSTRYVGNGSKSLRIVALGTSNDSLVGVSNGMLGMTANQTYTFMGRVRIEKALTSPNPTYFARLRVNGADGAGAGTVISGPTNAPGTYQVIQQFTIGSSGVASVYLYNGGAAAGDEVWWDDVLLVEGPYRGPYFDGANSYPDADMTTVWTGTAHNSTSRVSGVTLDPPYWSTASQAITLQSSEWADPGQFSLRQIPTYPTRGASYTNLASSGTPNGLIGGRTYTISATYHQNQPQGFDTPLQRLIGVSAGSPTPTIIGASDKAPDVAGSHRVTLTVTLPATNWAITLYNGGQLGDPDSWWDAVTIVDGAYDGPYFDGDSPDTADRRYMWLGTPNASMSTEEVYTLVSEGYIDGIPYTAANIADAPWYDADRADITSRFYGPFILSVEGIDDSTRSASVTEGILDGGVVGLVRHATRSVRVRALLTANGGDALDYGLAWLNAALSTSDCSQHAGGACGAVDLTFLAACPPVMDPQGRPEDNIAMLESTSALFRHLHNVTVISGPLIEQKMKSQDGRHVGLIVEWTMVAGTPWVFSESTQIPLGGGSAYTVIQDVPYNLVPYPSAELGSGSVLVATNYSTNPSVETNATGWAAGGTVTPAPTGARVAELAPSGTYSYKVTAAPTATGSGTVYAEQNVSLTGAPAGARVSVNMWSAAFLPVGTGSISAFKVQAIWRNGTTVVSTVDLGAVAPNGGVVSVRNIERPATTDNVTIRAIATASWTGAATLNVYADALAVTVP